MAKNSVGTRKTPGKAGAKTVRQNAAATPQGAAEKKHPQKQPKKRPLSEVEQQTVSLLRHSAHSIREISRIVDKDDSWVRRLRDRLGIERSDAVEIAARVDAASKQAIAEQTAGKTLADPEAVATTYVQAAAGVLARQRADQRVARDAVQRVLVRLTAMMDAVPTLSEALLKLGAYALATDDAELRKAAFGTLDSLNVEPLAKTARQLVASLRDLDSIERAAHGLKVVEEQDPAASRPRAVIVPAKAQRPSDED